VVQRSTRHQKIVEIRAQVFPTWIFLLNQSDALRERPGFDLSFSRNSRSETRKTFKINQSIEVISSRKGVGI
jgi:hypothetical protein